VHQDHRNTHQAAMVATREVGHVYCFQSPSATVDFRPTRFVTIDEQLERKLLAIQAFASQPQVRGYLKPDLIQSTARYWSRCGDGDYAEAFEVLRDAAPAGLSGGQAAGRAATAAPGRVVIQTP
jgi:LmbE family N-acetylglucosaminyl deacetylase